MGIARGFQALVVGVLCAAAGLARGQQTTPPQQAQGILEVIVSDESGQRVTGASVSVPGYRSTTGLNGTCRFGLLPGRYSVLVKKPGFRGRRLTAGVRPGETTSVAVKIQKLQPPRPPRE
jgi:uncharacterized membrane protein